MPEKLNNYTKEEILAAAELYPSLWIKKYGIKNEVGIPIEFIDRLFLKDIYDDMSPLQVVLKAPQIGLTTTQIIKSFYVAKKLNKQIIYTLPTESDIQDMAGGKINRIIAQNPVLSSWVKDHDTVSQKSIGDSIIYYRGTWTQKAAMMVSSDANIHDEVDASNPAVLTQYETRLAAKAGGWRWYFSHPSVIGTGVDIYWQKSDKKEWYVHCDSCDEYASMEWPYSIDQAKECYVCKLCQAELSVEAIRKGAWCNKDGVWWDGKIAGDYEYSGYHIPQLICAWIPAKKIIKDFKEKEAQYFYNFVLALPYADAKSKVTLETIKGLLSESTQKSGRTIFGVDTGIKIRWTCGDKNGLFDVGEVESYEDLQREVDRYKDWIMVIDQGGDIIGARKFAEDNPGKVFLCYFQQDKKSMQLIKWGKDKEYGMVRVDRNRLIQLVVDEMNDKRIPLQGNLEKWWDMWTHWQWMYRILGEDRVGNATYIWECDKSAHRNDWALAMCYWRVGIDRFAGNESEFVGEQSAIDKSIPEAPYRDADGNMPAPRLTMPLVAEKDSDWRSV